MKMCSDGQNTNPEMHTWETHSRKVEGGITVLSHLLATKLIFNSMSAMNVMWLYSCGIHGTLI